MSVSSVHGKSVSSLPLVSWIQLEDPSSFTVHSGSEARTNKGGVKAPNNREMTANVKHVHQEKPPVVETVFPVVFGMVIEQEIRNGFNTDEAFQ